MKKTNSSIQNECSTMIEAVAYKLAPHIITSAFIEEQLADTLERFSVPAGTLEGLTGIRERRFWDPGVLPSDAAVMAAQEVISKSEIDPQEIGCLLNTSVCRDYVEPSTAAIVHGKLNLSPHCLNYDIGNACLGFLNGIETIRLMIDAGLIKYGLVVDGEGSRDVVEATIKRLQSPDVTLDVFRENYATLTLGSGAAAMLLSHKDFSRSGHVINGSMSLAATQYHHLCVGQRDQMRSDPQALLIAGIELSKKAWQQCYDVFESWGDENIDLYAPHQISTRHMEALNKALGLSPEKHFLIIDTQGNIGPAGVPISLAMADECGRIKQGDHVAMIGIGSGLNCAAVSVTW